MDQENTESFIAMLALQGAAIGAVGLAAAMLTKNDILAGQALLGALACGWILSRFFAAPSAARTSDLSESDRRI
jgi:hypothetical protein